MEILLISEYFLLVALVIFLIASMRVISYISGMGFFKDIALALLLLGIVGTIGFAVVLRRPE